MSGALDGMQGREPAARIPICVPDSFTDNVWLNETATRESNNVPTPEPPPPDPFGPVSIDDWAVELPVPEGLYTIMEREYEDDSEAELEDFHR
ncbi:uncharacterized protein MYCFIDRAFT_212488 [Pseudocercospora fijiensis CIRAD86]|uniref:Uncharacterized protein n=1 Tax=Pseudocercospora fijiensis (strain CIRAD86) TaxID=383855 RepID=M3A2Y4_PSEFD|nr:uncharacterized protein MYCFIDRAFT_212488 [Pseudocercospora fijiensis CIRAD86]EME78896.1 hypothetical protein MYCFIDRAFT_212488 [Pseudocercospora fijiensis CIRAD86]